MEILRDANGGRHHFVLLGQEDLHRYRILHVFLLKERNRCQSNLIN